MTTEAREGISPDKGSQGRRPPGKRFLSRRGILISLTIAVAVCLATFFLVIPLYMDHRVRSYSQEAGSLYPGDTVQALIAYLESSSHSPQDKNHMVWTLGELRDPRALPVLHRLLETLAGDEPGGMSRYEVDKAIRKIEGKIRDPYFWK